MSIREEIVERRRARIRKDGHDMGASVPAARSAPRVPFGAPPFLVCEVKRRSPSRGAIAPDLDAVEQARRYAALGVRSVSVVTEQDSFGGSLDDLVRIKRELPGIAVLRKDFLVDVGDIEASWRAGADAVLLIAGILDPATLAALHRRTHELSMEALVEVHDPADVDVCRHLAPGLTGVNCRDLATFAVDLLHPLRLRSRIDWDTRLVFESGVHLPADIRLARSGGYDGVLVGETAVRSPGLIPGLLGAFDGPAAAGFWARLSARMRTGRPLAKICGITRPGDAEAAASMGADVLGFVFAPSPRRADPGLLRDLGKLDALKVAVTVSDHSTGSSRIDPVVLRLVEDGLVDAVQLHGEETPEECAAFAFPWYKAVRVRAATDVAFMDAFGCPRVLADAFSPQAAGGTGQRMDPELAREAGRRGPLWLAGGVNPDNVAEVVRALSPELIDASSGLEEAPGRKDHGKLRRFFEELDAHETV